MAMRWTKKEIGIIRMVARNAPESMTAMRRAAITQQVMLTSEDVEGCPACRSLQAIVAKEKDIRYEI